MSKRLLIILYLINLVGVFAIIMFVSENRFLNILFAIYLMLFTTIFYYAKQKKDK
ncbi:hypothetical protein ACAG96_02010 [Candidatus Izemoplasma sp. B36]|uniref:hypothetical protein n=1 Tax=Candidatus Izemoplasma sp. B36 TaxID=3242468 RepID=UPI0035571010